MSPTPPERPLRRSDVDARVVELRERLLHAGVTVSYLAPDAVNEPAVFDDHVDAAVRAFQQSRGLIVDGVVGRETLHALRRAQYSLGDRDLAYIPGADLVSGDDVSDLQRRLSHLGFYYGHIDGIFGLLTKGGVEEFQRNYGMPPSGVCDAATIEATQRVNRSLSLSKAFFLRDYEHLSQASSALRGRTLALGAGAEHRARNNPRDMESGSALSEAFVAGDILIRLEHNLKQFGAQVIRADSPRFPRTSGTTLVKASRPSLRVELHCDWLDHANANGISGFYWGSAETGEVSSPIGHRAVLLIMKELTARTQMTDLGVHPRAWDSLRTSGVPSVSVSLGYLSSLTDATRLSDPVFRQTLADALLIGIQRLFLLAEDDQPTGSLGVDDLGRYNA